MRRGNAKKIRHAIRLRRVRGGGKPFRHAVPLAETFRSRPPCAVVNREIAQDHQELPGIPALGPAPWGSDARISSSRATQFFSVLFLDIADLQFGRKSMKQIKTLAVILELISGSIRSHSLSSMLRGFGRVSARDQRLMPRSRRRPVGIRRPMSALQGKASARSIRVVPIGAKTHVLDCATA